MVGLVQILLMDQDRQSRLVLRTGLQERGYVVHNLRTSESVLECVRRHQVDLVILNASSLSLEVKRICRVIGATPRVALIVLASCHSEEERIAALDAGADDCLGKPFLMIELVARVRAVIRRVHASASRCQKQVQLEDLQINLVTRRVISRGHPVHLTPTEFNLLQYLIDNPNVPIPHAKILQSVWGPEQGSQIEYLRVFINQLRKKIEADPGSPQFILTEPWVGYRFNM